MHWQKTIFIKVLLLVLLSSLQKNTLAQYQVNGASSQLSCECFEVTPDTGATSGSVWNVTQIDLTQPFDYTFDIFMGCNNFNSGADGIAFVLQPLSVNAGSGGGGLGYAGIVPSLAIEFDTFENNQYADGADDHIAIMSNGVVDHNLPNNLAGPVSASSTSGEIEDCAWHTVQIVWEPALNTIAVFFDGVFRTAYFGDIINTIFGGNSMVYWGWTGSTGFAYNQHQFCISLQPDFTPSATSICEGETVSFTESSAASNVIQNYAWDFGDNTTATGQNVSHTYSTAGQYDVTLTITSDGCDESITQQITVNALPTVDLGADVAVCDGESIQLNNPNSVGAGTYQWSPATFLDNSGIASPTSTPTSSQNYTLDFTDTNGCTNSDDITVNFNPLPTADAGADLGFCDGAWIQLNASGGLSYSWDNAGSLDNASSQDPIASPAVNTIYTVTVTDANNCENTDQVQVTVYPLPAIDAGPDLTVCEGFGTQLNVIGVGTVQWDPDPTLSNVNIPDPMAIPAVTTTYTATLTDGNNCQSTDDVTVNVVTVLPVDAGPDLHICVGESIQLNATGAVSYTWSPATGLDNANIPDPTFSGNSNATITLTGADGNGCLNTDVINITVNPLPNADAGVNQSICIGESATLNASGGVSYVWDNAGTLNNANISGPTASPTTTTTYEVIVTDANDCSASDQVDVTVYQLPTVSAGADVTICESTSTQLNAVGIGTFSWDNAASLDNPNTASPNASPAATTTYTVTLIDANNCMNTDDVVVTVVNAPNVSAGTDESICIGETVQLQATGAVTYSWTSVANLDNGLIASPTFFGTLTETLTVTGTDANNCSATDDVTVTVNPLPNANAGTDQTICEGEITTLSASGGVSYVWDNAGTLSNANVADPTASPAVTTAYEVTVTDANSCSNTDQIQITVVQAPAIDAGSDVSICDGESIQLSAVGVGTFSWDNAGSLNDAAVSNPNASPSVTTLYTVTLTDANNCNNMDDVEVTVFETPEAILNDPVPVCNGSNMLFPDNSTGPIVSWDWDFGDITQGTGQNPTHIYPAVGTYPVTLTVTSADNCSSTTMATAEVITGPIAAITVSNGLQFCEGDCVEFDAGASTGPIVNYYWDFGVASATATDSATSYCYQTLANYDVTLTVSTADGCDNSLTQMIPVNPNPVADFTSTVACEGEDTEFTNLSSVTSGFIATNNWHFGDLSQSDLIEPLHEYDQLGTYSVMLAIATQMGCVDTTFAQVTVNETPDVSVSATLVCEGLETEFTNATVPNDNTIASWNWDFGDTQTSADQQPEHQYAQYGLYDAVLTATTVEGCSDTDSARVEVFAVPEADFEASVYEGCEPLVVQFYNNSTIANGQLDHFVWDLGNASTMESVAPDITYINDGSYDISMIAVAENGGCSDTLIITDMIRVNKTPEASFTMSPTEEITMLDPRVRFTNTSIDALTYDWDFGDGASSSEASPTHDFDGTGVYEIQLTAINNMCEDVAIAEVRVHPETFIYIPNALTPNNDGVNDTFKPDGLGVKQYSMVIHDRWGKEIFQTSNWEEAWDGTYMGKEVPQGVYVYRVEVVTVRSMAKTYMGSVTVTY